MRSDLKKSICIRLNRAEFSCLAELATETGDTPTALAARLVVDALSAVQREKTMDQQLRELERRLTRTNLAMFAAVANYDDAARHEFHQRVKNLLATNGVQK